MAGHPQAGVDVSGMAPMGIGKGAAQPVLIAGHDDDVTMIGHQTMGPDLGPGPARRLAQQIATEGLVAVFKEGPGAPVAALGHVMGQTGNDEAGQACHWRCIAC